ncbi:hypothetical protein SCAR479_09407 [Seiridium cardinale]|uniref:Translation initiation factor IF-3 n=1 Tax=Seiridium cardinale TaxID=138064 RepID=A0ABR2XJ36_9PEZI
MQPRRCLFSPSRALRSVFLPTHLEATSTARPPFYLLSPRLFSTTTPQLYIRSRPKPTGAGGPKPSRLPSDNAIPYRWVRIADCRAHGLQPEKEDSTSDLSAPQRTADILKGLNRQKYSLVMVAVPSRRRAPAESEEGEDESLQAQAAKERQNAPVCRIMDKFAFAKAAEEKEKAARQKELNRKELELNWAIAPNDLQHRLRQFRDFLEKGKRVELMLAKKKRGRRATKEEGDTLVAALKETAEGVGAKQVKMDGNFPGIVNMVFEGKATEKSP